MATVYSTPRFGQGWPLSVLTAMGLTAVVFGILPFTTAISGLRQKQLLLRSADLAAPPPVAEAEPPPPPPADEKPPEPPPKLADNPQPMPMSANLDLAVGSGGALAGFGDLRSVAAAESASDTFDVADLEKRPEPVSQVGPVYPAELRKARIDGAVTVIFVITEEGRVDEPRVDTSSRPEFERPALDAIRKWRYRPGMKDGKSVRTFARQPFRFTPPQ
jgi:protein TonB